MGRFLSFMQRLNEAYDKGFEKEYRDGNEGAKEVEAILHKQDVKLDALDEEGKSLVKKLIGVSSMKAEDWVNIQKLEQIVQKI